MTKPRKPSPAQLAALRNLAAGRPMDWNLHGRSAYGGLTATAWALHQRGWTTAKGEITDAGRAVVETAK